MAETSGKPGYFWTYLLGLLLDLLVAGILADDTHLALAPDDTALLADASDAGSDLHG
jgi:hypothetical protein